MQLFNGSRANLDDRRDQCCHAFRWRSTRVFSAFIVFICAWPSIARSQADDDTTRLLKRVRQAEAEYQIVWLRTWIQSEADRHSVNIPYPSSDRFLNRDSTITHRMNFDGYLNDTLMFAKEKPVFRSQNIYCRPLDQRWGSGLLNQTLREKAQRVPWAAVIYGNQGLIESRITGFSVCPSWYQGPGRTPPWDERFGIDQAISTPRL